MAEQSLSVTYAELEALLSKIGKTQYLSEPSSINGLTTTTRPLFDVTRANKLSFLSPEQIIIEKSIDDGVTWTDAEIPVYKKVGLFSGLRPQGIELPRIGGKKSPLSQLRVTFTAMKYTVPAGTIETERYKYWNSVNVTANERYCTLESLYFWLSSNSDRLKIGVERANGNSSDNWTPIFTENTAFSGWHGMVFLRFGEGTFGGGITQASQPWNYRVTFTTRGPDGSETLNTSSQTEPQNIFEIKGFGANSYVDSQNSQLANTDHIYRWDSDQNTIFPKKILAEGQYEVYNTSNLPKSIELPITLPASWNSEGILVVSNNNIITSTQPVEMYPDPAITKEQLTVLQKANIIGVGQAVGSVSIKAYGKIPSISLPVRLIIRRDI